MLTWDPSRAIIASTRSGDGPDPVCSAVLGGRVGVELGHPNDQYHLNNEWHHILIRSNLKIISHLINPSDR